MLSLFQADPTHMLPTDSGTAQWFIGIAFSALTTALGILWRQSVAESKRKDELIDRLLDAANRQTQVGDRAVSLVERERKRAP